MSMLFESLNAMIQAGEEALHESCGLSVLGYGVSLLQQGSLTFPSHAELQIRNGPLQRVHMGMDAALRDHVMAVGAGADGGTDESFAATYLRLLLGKLDARNPRGEVTGLDGGPTTLISRGRRSFGLRLETEVGQLFLLTEAPSRLELELARGGDYLPSMESSYLPAGWESRDRIDSHLAMENFLLFVRKVEVDVALETGGDRDTPWHGLLLGPGTLDGEPCLTFVVELGTSQPPTPEVGQELWASVGIRDRSLRFPLVLLGRGYHTLESGADIPVAYFQAPQHALISQQRLAFRIPLENAIRVELRRNDEMASPWNDVDHAAPPLFVGEMADLSFSGARLVADEQPGLEAVELNSCVSCHIHFPDRDAPLVLLSAVRRSTRRQSVPITTTAAAVPKIVPSTSSVWS